MSSEEKEHAVATSEPSRPRRVPLPEYPAFILPLPAHVFPDQDRRAQVELAPECIKHSTQHGKDLLSFFQKRIAPWRAELWGHLP